MFTRALCITPISAACLVAFSAIGCASTQDLRRPERYENGLILILPGIEGRSELNINLARGLDDGGLRSAIEIYDWTAGRAMGWFVNLTDEERNRRRAERIGARIRQYQRAHPGRAVHVIGHSGGGGVAVFVLEELPREARITSALLLAPALSPDYDLRRALRRTELGIWNFYSPYDVGFLNVGTTVFGTIDRSHSAAAGSVGFDEPAYLGVEGRSLYRNKLHQVRYNERMRRSGNLGDHTGWVSRKFAREWLAPLLYAQDQRADGAEAEDGGRAGPPPE
jgi:pimeloyl-ACP methyl ester carboxylesterase